MLAQISSTVLRFPPLAYVAVALGTVWYLITRDRLPANVPPYPVKPYPIVGHIPMVLKGGGPLTVFHEWRKRTGDIFSVKIGQRVTIVINSYAILKETFVKNADIFSDRNESYITKGIPLGNLGIVGSSGHNWKEQRTVSMSILRSFGMGKNLLAEKINEEIWFFLDALSALKGEPTNVQIATDTSVSNVICAILFGNRFEYDDPDFNKFIKLLHDQFVLLGNFPVLDSFPWVRYLPGDRFGAKRLVDNVKHIRAHIRKTMKETKEAEGGMDNFINAYYYEMNNKINSGTETYLDETNLLMVVSNLFAAGTETTSTTLMWVLLFAIHYPDVQEKVYKEIFDVIGTERTPSMKDKSKMNYTSAFILETQRVGCIASFSLGHLCSKTVEIGGYTIPKGAGVIANLSEILNDEKTWGDPSVFRPERFLDKDNNVTVPEEFVPFSLGRRYCMGESFAKMELFLFITSIFQRFQILPEDPKNLPTMKPRFGITHSPTPFKPRLIERAQ